METVVDISAVTTRGRLVLSSTSIDEALIHLEAAAAGHAPLTSVTRVTQQLCGEGPKTLATPATVPNRLDRLT